MEKDREVNTFYISNDWNILRVWEHDIRNNFEETINMIVNFINNTKFNNRRK